MSKSTRITGVSDDPLAPDQCLPDRASKGIDPGSLARLSKLGCVQEEMAEFFGVSISFFRKQLHERPELTEAVNRGKTDRKISLRHRQTQIALDDRRGNQQVAMLIWLGKQDPSQGGLGQQESFKIKGDPDHPLEVSVSSASELLAARLAQYIQRAGQTEAINLNGDVIDIQRSFGHDTNGGVFEPSGANGASPLRREIEASQEPDGGTK